MVRKKESRSMSRHLVTVLPRGVASFPDHSQILSCNHGEKSRDKIWEWPGNEATRGICKVVEM